MLSRTKCVLAAIGAVTAMSLAASEASAVTVAYTTTGTFSNGVGATYTVNDTTLSFAGTASATSQTGSVVAANFGSFTLTTLNNGLDPFSGNFTLTISQTLPIVGVANPVASVNGSVSTDANTGVVLLSFTSPVSIGTIDYFINNVSVTVPNGYIPGSAIGPIELTGHLSIPGNTPNVVPLPGAVTAGTALLGTLGIVRRSRRRTDVVAG